MREQWGTRRGFVLASIGSAVGLGNIWRFAYVAGENGGGAFLAVYILLVAAIGIPLVIAELAIGKRGAADAVTACETLAPRSPWRHAGWLGIAGATLVLSYYGVIAGWALRYFAASSTGGLHDAAGADIGAYFSRFIANAGEPLGWQLAMMLAAMFIVAGGIGRGIERVNLFLMPLLAVIVVVMALYALSLPGAEAGISFLFAPDWSAVANPAVILAALGQAFFSVGVGMAVFVTYGSYMRSEFRIPASAAVIVGGDTLFAIIAGLAIFPAVFAFGANPAAGPELAFITLPQIFQTMPGGLIAAPVFFFLLSAAALTSMVSLLEVPVAAIMHRSGMSRRRAVAALGLGIFLLGVPSGLSYGPLAGIAIAGLPVLDAVDYAASNVLLPMAGLALAVLLGWAVPRKTVMALTEIKNERYAGIFVTIIRAIPAIILLLIGFRLFG